MNHTQRTHALLSASSAHRWSNCTPSARIEETYPNTTTPAAEEGTTAHELAEHKLKQHLGQPTTRPNHPTINEEMEAHTDAYADHVYTTYQQLKQQDPNTYLTLEHQLDYSHIVPEGFGTVDALITTTNHIIVIDFKYGKGVKVDATNNPQMRLYALAALHHYGMLNQITTITTTIYQPRINNYSEETLTPEELTNWAETTIKPAAQLAHKGEGQLNPGTWCTFCKHAPQCTQLAKHYFTPIPHTTHLPQEEPQPNPPQPHTLTDEQITTILTHSTDLKKWLTAVEDHALKQALEGHNYPGLKLVAGRSIRKYSDPEKVAEAALQAGVDPWEKKLIGVTAMTKALGGAKKFNDAVGQWVTKTEPKPTLVPQDDPRKEWTKPTAAELFKPTK